MVRMIPNSIAPEIKSEAEKKLFSLFQTSQSSEPVIILHSLGIAEHTSNIFGEIDFVIICSDGLLCVEVKGGAVERTDATWTFTNRYGKRATKHEGPFNQAQGNMHSLRQYMKKRLGEYDPISRAQYASCVVMPDCDFDYDGIDIIRAVLFDHSYKWTLEDIISHSFGHWRDRCNKQHGFVGGYLTDSDIERAAELLRGDFRFVPSLKDQIDRAEQELCALTDEQYDILESLGENNRMLIPGMAGTGKTFLAVEQCRRAFWEGKGALYLCFNHNMAQYIKCRFERETIDVDVFTLHAFMMKACGDTWSPDKDRQYYYQELPERFLGDGINPKQYDLIVIDEGQDLINSTYLQCINKILVNGLAGGSWSFYYDPNQNLFNHQSELDKLLPELRRLSATYTLSVNCRNTKQIANANTLMTNIPQVSRIKASGPHVEPIKYSSLEEELNLVIGLIQQIKDGGVNCGDIVMLSAYSADNPLSCMSKGTIPVSIGKLKQDQYLWKAKKNELRLSTISAFKGLESKVIVLIDVDAFSEESRRLQNYVAISRACAALYVLYDNSVESERQAMLGLGYQRLAQ